jgi:hypothetical protein
VVVALSCVVVGSENCQGAIAPLSSDHANNSKSPKGFAFTSAGPVPGYALFRATIGTFYAKAESAMNGISRSQYRVAIRASAGGRYTYELFTLAGEPRTFLADDTGFDSPQEAERAGYEALDRLVPVAMPPATEPSAK